MSVEYVNNGYRAYVFEPNTKSLLTLMHEMEKKDVEYEYIETLNEALHHSSKANPTKRFATIFNLAVAESTGSQMTLYGGLELSKIHKQTLFYSTIASYHPG